MRNALLLCLALMLMLSCAAPLLNANTSISSLQANVTVACPFYLSLNSLPLYIRGNSINLNYTTYTTALCTIQNLAGNITLKYKGNGTVAYFSSLSGNALETPVTFNILPINTLALHPSDYIAVLNFSTFKSMNSSSRSITIVNNVNITMTSFSVSPITVALGAPVTFYANITNNGELASNTITIKISIAGPAGQNYLLTEPVGALAPNQTAQLAFQITNVTGVFGGYTARANATYFSNNALESSNTKAASYQVPTPPSGGGGGGGGPSSGPMPTPGNVIASIPQIAFTELPFFSSMFTGTATISEIGIKNIMTVPETVSFQIPKFYDTILSISSNSLYLLPGQAVSVKVSFYPDNLPPGMYSVPLNITVKAPDGSSVTKTQYLTYSIVNKTSEVSVLTQISLSLGNATVLLQLNGARNATERNASLMATLPPLIVANASQISAGMLPSSVTLVNGVPRISWLVPYLPAGKNITVSYVITNPNQVGLLTLAQDMFIMQSQPTPESLLRLINLQVPTLHTNSDGNITVDALYTDTYQRMVYFTLTSQSSLKVINPIQVVNAISNKLIERTFTVAAGNENGTFLLNLGISTNGASLNYSIPVLVVPGPAMPITTVPQNAIVITIPGNAYADLMTLLVILLIVLLLYLILHRRREHFIYRRKRISRAEQLIRVHEQIRRSQAHGRLEHETPAEIRHEISEELKAEKAAEGTHEHEHPAEPHHEAQHAEHNEKKGDGEDAAEWFKHHKDNGSDDGTSA